MSEKDAKKAELIEELNDELVLEKVTGGASLVVSRSDLFSKFDGRRVLQSGHDNPDARIPNVVRFVR